MGRIAERNPRAAYASGDAPKYAPGSREGTRRAKALILDGLEKGYTVEKACFYASRSIDAWKRYKKADPDFREKAEFILARRSGKIKGEPVPDFPEFCETYLGMRQFWHQLQWFDVLEGREPRDLHPSQTYIQGTPQNVLVNTPPGHAKSTTITVAYVVWRILKDANIKVMIVSKKQKFAENFLYAIKSILTSPRYLELQKRWSPAEGWERDAVEWSATQIRLRSDESDHEKDPTVQVLGIGGQIYGSRSDLIIVDDAVVLDNAGQWEQQLRWIRQEVDSRLYSASSKLLVVGTRVAPYDLYKALLDDANYDGMPSPWTSLTQPAILEDSEDPAQRVTLWPRSNVAPRGVDIEPDADGLYPKWDGAALEEKRRRTDARTWALVYMQEDVDENTTFPDEAVRGCVDRTRNPGLLVPGLPGHPERGMAGMYVVAGLDPASTGHTAAVALAVERDTGRRWVLNVHNEARMSPDAVRTLIKQWTVSLQIREWRIERNAFQTWLTQDREINQWLAQRGVVLEDHLTGRNKLDVEFGVASMEPLFRGWEDGWNLLRLPANHQSFGVKSLIDQLVTWFPETKGKTDCVMALWFAELRARQLVEQTGGSMFEDNPWLSPMQARQRGLVDVYATERM